MGMAPFSRGEGLIEKINYPVVPPHTEYWLTKRGLKLRGVVAAMARFAQ
jgi:DNA-binding HxlR family transcriptional regulator